MVGLPARGKTYISQKGNTWTCVNLTTVESNQIPRSVCRYLTWLGIKTKVFNVGNYRRKLHGASLPHTFFDPHNPIGEQHRREAAAAALEDMLQWYETEQGIVGIYDATNSTYQRRKWLHDELTKRDILVLFIESICQDETLILNNIKDVKLSSPDYVNMDPDDAAVDFRARIDHYQELYQTITEEDFTYIKLINVGSQVIINMIQGYLESRIVYYLMNLHIAPRKIYMSRVSSSFVLPVNSSAHELASTANPCTTCTEKLVAIQSYLQEVVFMHRSYLSWSEKTSVISHWLCGHQRWNVLYRLASCFRTQNYNGKHWMNSMLVYVTAWHMKRLRKSIQRTLQIEMKTSLITDIEEARLVRKQCVYRQKLINHTALYI